MKVVIIGSIRWRIGTAIKDYGEGKHIRCLIEVGNAIKRGRR